MINKIDPTNTVNFKGPLDGMVTTTLRTLDSNPMVNAVGIDLFAMVGPRTYIDSKNRNKYAGAETFFRELSGTLIVCLSASYLARGISKIANKVIKPETPINTTSWFSNDSVDFLKDLKEKSDSDKKYMEGLLDSLSGLDGDKTKTLRNANWNNIEWVDEKRWEKFSWDNDEFKNIHKKLKDKESIVSVLERVSDSDVTKSDTKKVLNIVELRLTNVLGAGNVTAKSGEKSVSSSLHNILRDAVDMSKDVFKNKNIDSNEAINKILKTNRIKSIGALVIASVLGLTNQYINRKITEKRTGTKGFVGDTDYQNKINQNNKSKNKSQDKGLMLKKIGASLGMAAMTIAVMKVKSPCDFLKKLEFTGPVTSGNAIKTVYASTLIGRFLASDSNDELRETVTRDYLGFLNWLVLGGFAAKATANILDKDRKNLFNISTPKNGKEVGGIKNWLNNISLKSHNEVAVKGKDFSKKNMWKLNVAHVAGLAYSTLALGVLLPKLNIWVTERKQAKNSKNFNA
jgi:hypothetical protein